MLGTGSGKATAANFQKYQGLESYWKPLEDKSPGASLITAAHSQASMSSFHPQKVGPGNALVLVVVVCHKLADRNIAVCFARGE